MVVRHTEAEESPSLTGRTKLRRGVGEGRLSLTAGGRASARFVKLTGGWFLMGSADEGAHGERDEGPIRRVRVDPFRLSATCVSNREFAAFVNATGYLTDAENAGYSHVFSGSLPDNFPQTRTVPGAEWWREVAGAYWRRPEGWHSTLRGRENHPVVHISWRDANAYCRWDRSRLPTEAEWEYAARGGLQCQRFPWGDTLRPGGLHRMNVWQGLFPVRNTRSDGYVATAPVTAYPPNPFGLYNMTGNVWEWTADWFGATRDRPRRQVNPGGPSTGEHKVLRGGSYLCPASYHEKYRVSARDGMGPAGSVGDVGFRCARNA